MLYCGLLSAWIMYEPSLISAFFFFSVFFTRYGEGVFGVGGGFSLPECALVMSASIWPWGPSLGVITDLWCFTGGVITFQVHAGTQGAGRQEPWLGGTLGQFPLRNQL